MGNVFDDLNRPPRSRLGPGPVDFDPRTEPGIDAALAVFEH